MNIKSLLIAAVLIWIAIQVQKPTPPPEPISPNGAAVRAIIVRESSITAPQFNNELRGLMVHDAAAWLKENHIDVDVLDVDSKEPDGRPAEILKQFAPYKLPELLRLTADGKLIDRRPCPTTKVEIIKALGKK